jgi:hypothetical protein
VLNPNDCRLAKTERLELLKNCHVIFWDEVVSNDKKVVEAAYRAFRLWKISCLFVFFGDFRQILPVVKKGTATDILAATISSSSLWPEFEVEVLTQNMRLTALQNNLSSDTTPEEQLEYQKQLRYNNSLLALAEGGESDDCIIVKQDTTLLERKSQVALKGIQYFVNNEESKLQAYNWLYPDGFSPDVATDNCILAATNASGDIWNSYIQSKNPNEATVYKSTDHLCQVDDEFGHLQNILNDKVLNHIKGSGIPEHTLTVKVNDVCLLLRHMTAMSPEAATNQRVRIVQLNCHTIRVVTISETPVQLIIPRIRFKFQTHHGNGYLMMRVQFPLRLAYCMTYNKSQGQTLHKVLLDTTEQPFTHGHAYVSLSRVRSVDNIRIFCNSSDVVTIDDKETCTITNIVYIPVLQHISR